MGGVDTVFQEAQPELPGSLGNNSYHTTLIHLVVYRVRLESVAI